MVIQLLGSPPSGPLQRDPETRHPLTYRQWHPPFEDILDDLAPSGRLCQRI